MDEPAPPRTLVIACGALARELLAIVELDRLDNVTIECLPASLHNRPKEIPERVRERIRRARRGDAVGATADLTATDLVADDAVVLAPAPAGEQTAAERGPARYDRILVGYADCGTGGLLERVCDEEGVEMLAGAHCYEFFATSPRFAELQDHALGTFYLTDFLVKHFDRMVWRSLGLDRHPELRDDYFGSYTRLVYLAQTDDPRLVEEAEAAADRLGLELAVERTGYGELQTTLVEIGRAGAVPQEGRS